MQNAQFSCKFNSSLATAFINSYSYIVGDEERLKRALFSRGPLAVAINTNIPSIFDYDTGVYDDKACDDNVNHAVLLIGYGTDNTTTPPKDFWIIKNSWGTSWGENGYFRLERGKNRCGITRYVTYPIIY